ncbi:hypothetical protein J3R03_003653 [Actinoplanes couchii]|nr:hypothetical protein [Actinoplanes couchii]
MDAGLNKAPENVDLCHAVIMRQLALARAANGNSDHGAVGGGQRRGTPAAESAGPAAQTCWRTPGTSRRGRTGLPSRMQHRNHLR